MTKIKICGIKTIDEARASWDAGADYLGLLVDLPETNLSMTVNEARRIVSDCRGLKFIVLTIEKDPKKLVSMITDISPWGVQLLRPTVECVQCLKGTSSKIISVVHIVDNDSMELAKRFYDSDYLLLDSKIGNHLGGTGKVHNWDISKEIIKNSPIPVFLAGGLNETNVVTAIESLNPYAVDVESSLRNSTGFRDIEKIKSLIKKVRSN
ncbi:MAG: phosphoribosylanthranilate isomerase [bacterium]